MKLGTLALTSGNCWSGTLKHHDQIIQLTMAPLKMPTGPTHKLLIDGEDTAPASHVWTNPDRTLRGRLALNQGATTLYLSLMPTSAGAYDVAWHRPTKDTPVPQEAERAS